MPLIYDDEPGSWGRQSEGWPTLYCADENEVRRAYIACTKGNVVPYGSYVCVGFELRVATPEQLEALLVYLRESAFKTYETLRDHYVVTGQWEN